MLTFTSLLSHTGRTRTGSFVAPDRNARWLRMLQACIRGRKRVVPLKMAFLDDRVILDIKKGNTKAVLSALLDQNVNARDPVTGDTALHIAIAYHKDQISAKLLNVKELRVNAQNAKGQSPLHIAFQNHNLSIVPRMCKRRPDLALDVTDQEGDTILHYAAAKRLNAVETRRLMEIIRRMQKLLMSGNKQGNTPLHTAVMYGSVELVKVYVTLGPEALMRRNQAGELPLDLAFKSTQETIPLFILSATPEELYSQNDILIKLIDANAYSTLRHLLTTQSFGRQAFCRKKSASSKSLQSAAHALSHVRSYNSPDAAGRTPLHIAVLRGCVEIVECLLCQPDIDVTLQDRNGNTPVHLACQSPNSLQLVSLFLTWLEARHALTTSQATRHVPKQFRCPASVTLPIWPVFLAAIINRQNKEGKTFLHLLVGLLGETSIPYLEKSVLSSIERLVRLSADLEICDHYGNTPLLSVVTLGNVKGAQYLRAAGASVTARNFEGLTAVDIALAHKDPELVSALMSDEVLQNSFRKDDR